MNRIIKKSSGLLFNLLIGFNVAGCFVNGPNFGTSYYNDEKIKDGNTDYLRYSVMSSEKTKNLPIENQDNYVLITGFTELGKQQERLDIPSEIEGYPVRCIGLVNFTNNASRLTVVYPEKLKKLFVTESVWAIDKGAKELDIMMCSERYRVFTPHKTYLYKSVYDYNFKEDELYYGEGSSAELNIALANITFMNNYPLEDNGGHYRLDNVEKDEKLIEPPAPELEGYTFTGWYTEEECIYKYDFDTTLDIELGYEFVLYAGWKANA